MPAVHDVVFSERISQGAVGGATYHTTIIAAVGGWEQRQANWATGRLRWDISKMLTDRDVLHYVIAFFRARRGQAYGFLFKDWSDYYAGMSWVSDVLSYTGFERFGTGDGVEDAFQLAKTYVGEIQVHVDTALQPMSAFSAYEVFGGALSLSFAVAPSSGASVRANGVVANESANGSRTDFTFSNFPSESRKITRPKRGTLRVYVDGSQKTEGTHFACDYETGIVTFDAGSIPTAGQKVQWAGEYYVPVRFDSDLQRVMVHGYGQGQWNNFGVVEVLE